METTIKLYYIYIINSTKTRKVMKTTFGANKHRGNYFLIPTVNLIINKARDTRFKDNWQFHFNFLTFHYWVSLGE